MEDRHSREEILRRLDLEYQRLISTVDGLSWEQWLIPNVVGIWSTNDVMAHLAYWMRFSFEELQAAVNGKSVPHPEGTDDEINARAVASFQDESPRGVHSIFTHDYRALWWFIKFELPDSAFEPDSLIEKALDETIHGALANNTYEHWPIHEAQIREWIGA